MYLQHAYMFKKLLRRFISTSATLIIIDHVLATPCAAVHYSAAVKPLKLTELFTL